MSVNAVRPETEFFLYVSSRPLVPFLPLCQLTLHPVLFITLIYSTVSRKLEESERRLNEQVNLSGWE